MTYLRSEGRFLRKLTIGCGIALLAACGLAQAAEPVSESQILRALTPKSVTRNLSGMPAQQNTQRQTFINSLRTKTRSLTVDERTEVATIAKERPSIDLEIYFDYNSSEIASKAVPDLMNLGRALTNQALQGGVFLLSGHTDARGSQEYNQQLSERRSQSVRAFLVQNFRIASENLVSAGYGKEQLKNRANPFAAENRRVQVTNLATKQEAGN
ncbi:MAG: OmpA family protein [Bradyrhizobium sp.]|uniref:OmpA family protein n=1 Tax=Bradyrhizobium sp. TaxID=376 RepID=UPI0025BEEB52|nr:OmpA family protein [Bradyrhizobium sp.]MBI5261147.1 OmpA family protein [Bradyrhizobium sp.]